MQSHVSIGHQVSHLIEYEVLSNAVYLENLQCSNTQVKLWNKFTFPQKSFTTQKVKPNLLQAT